MREAFHSIALRLHPDKQVDVALRAAAGASSTPSTRRTMRCAIRRAGRRMTTTLEGVVRCRTTRGVAGYHQRVEGRGGCRRRQHGRGRAARTRATRAAASSARAAGGEMQVSGAIVVNPMPRTVLTAGGATLPEVSQVVIQQNGRCPCRCPRACRWRRRRYQAWTRYGQPTAWLAATLQAPLTSARWT